MTEIRWTAARATALALVSALGTAPWGSPLAAAEASAVEVTSRLAELPAAPELRLVGDELRLTHDEAVRIAVERNLGLRVQRYERQRNRLGIDQAMGIYDLALFGGFSASKDESPAASNLEGAAIQKQERQGFSVGLSQLLPTGGSGTINWENGRFETNSQFFDINPSFSSGLDFTIEQPLLRGFGRAATEYALELARITDGGSRDQFVQRVIGTVQQVQTEYWLLVGTRYALRVAEESLALARELHHNNRTRVEVGTLAPLELVQSEAGIAAREEDIIRARAAIGDAEDRLRRLLNLPAGDLWTKTIVPETDVEVPTAGVDVAASIASALTQRSELALQRTSIRGREIDAAFYRQELKPRLDLRATYGFNGVGGDVIVRDANGEVIEIIDGSWGDSVEQVTDIDFPGWSVALEFSVPLQNRSARARSAMAEVALEQGRLELEDLEQQIATEVRAAARALDTARQQIASAKVSVRLEERNLDAERKKYENGLSTSFQILQVQEDLTSARYRLVSALTSYRSALVEYQRSVGRLLEEAGIQVVD